MAQSTKEQGNDNTITVIIYNYIYYSIINSIFETMFISFSNKYLDLTERMSTEQCCRSCSKVGFPEFQYLKIIRALQYYEL